MNEPSRRDFLATTAAVGAASLIAPNGFGAWESIQAASPGKIINIGLIGAGGRGSGAANDSLSINPNVRIVAIAELQRRVAQESRCAYFDTLTAIGGPGTIELWSREDPPRAQRDHVHYTWLGYQAWGQALADELLAAYARARPVR